MENHTKRQHFLPEMYLKHFTYDQQQEFVYTTNKFMHVEYKSISSICYELWLYEMYNALGLVIDINNIEHKYRDIENQLSPIIDRCIQKVESKIPLTNHEQFSLYMLYQMLFFRHHIILEHGPTVLEDRKICNNFCDSKNSIKIFGIKYLHDLTLMLWESHNLVICINNTEIPFMTSNNPFGHIENHKTNNEREFLYLPLTPKILLIFTQKHDKRLPLFYSFANEEFVSNVNGFQYKNALDNEFRLISNNEQLLNEFVEYYKSRPEYMNMIESLKTRK